MKHPEKWLKKCPMSGCVFECVFACLRVFIRVDACLCVSVHIFVFLCVFVRVCTCPCARPRQRSKTNDILFLPVQKPKMNWIFFCIENIFFISFNLKCIEFLFLNITTIIQARTSHSSHSYSYRGFKEVLMILCRLQKIKVLKKTLRE